MNQISTRYVTEGEACYEHTSSPTPPQKPNWSSPLSGAA